MNEHHEIYIGELKATKQFVEKVNELRRKKQLGPISWNTAVKFLMARKFDVNRAVNLYELHESTRQREGLIKLNPEVDPLRSELSAGKFTILPVRDSSGAAIAVFTAHLHNPFITSHQTTLQGVVYQLDAALESTETQRCGLVFIYDMTDSIYQNFDYALSQKILTLLKGAYPARLKKVLIVTAPLWFRAPFKVLRLFVREKLRDRVYTVTLPELVNHIPAQCLPQQLGGSLEVNHEAWLLRCFESMTIRHEGLNKDTVMDCNNFNDPINIQKEVLVLEEDLEDSTSDNQEIIFGDEGSECSDESSMEKVSYNDIAGESDEGDSDAERHLKERGVPFELTTAEEEKQLAKDSNIKAILQEVKDVNKVNGHMTERLNGKESPSALASSGSSGFSDDDSLHLADGGGQSLDEFVSYLKLTGRNGLYSEYAQIKNKSPDGTFDTSRQRWNQYKNRYTDVLSYDHSRVILTAEDNEEHTTYINANYVDGYKQKNAFISSQGPLPCTFGDFWRMIWEQRVCVVVMTTKTLERGRTKCGQYWPVDKGSSVTHSHFSVTNLDIESDENYVVSRLSVLDSRTGEERTIEHLQFTSWPDYGVPDSALAMLSFLSKVRELQADRTACLGDGWKGHPLGPPILVHCSAGIGRTGTFCTLDICLRRLEDVCTIDVKGTVEKIRSQRAYSIQMPDQYVFCHLAILEYALKTNKLSEVDLTGFEDDGSDSD